jgi:hypothetical protein
VEEVPETMTGCELAELPLTTEEIVEAIKQCALDIQNERGLAQPDPGMVSILPALNELARLNTSRAFF